MLIVEDGGPGLPEGVHVAARGISGAGSTGLGLSIVAATAAESGGRLLLGRSAALSGARVEVFLGPPADLQGPRIRICLALTLAWFVVSGPVATLVVSHSPARLPRRTSCPS